MADTPLASRRALRLAAIGATAALLTALPHAASAAPAAACDDRSNNTYQKLLECVTLEGVREHQAEFQKIADNSTDPVYPGTRAAGTVGYDLSVEYVAGLLRDAGYEVTLDPVDVTFNFPAELRQLTPVQADYETGVFTGSGSGEVEGNVIPVDIDLTPTGGSTSGCEAADYAGLDFTGDNDIALVQRGTCFFGTKAYYAEQAGAEAVIIFNEGNTPERSGLIVADATSVDEPIPGAPGPVTHGIPVVGASFADGAALAQPGSTAFVLVLPAETRSDFNVIAELPGKNEDNVVMAGAHLDSVIEGPGINDNGSGSAALLETALMMANLNPENTLRFAWWAAEEQGLVGSHDYVDGLSEAELDRIALYMNYDMVGSPNYIFMVYDADESTFEAPSGRAGGVGSDRGRLRVVLHRHRRAVRRHRVLGPERLRGVHPRRHPLQRTLHGRGGHQDPRAGGDLGRRSRGAVRPAATTRPATPSRTSTCTRSRSTATSSRSPC